MASGKRLHPNHEEVDEAVRKIHSDKKPRLRELLILKEKIRKEIIEKAAKKQEVKRVVQKKRLQHLNRLKKGKNTVRYQDDLNRKKKTPTLNSGVSPARNFNIR